MREVFRLPYVENVVLPVGSLEERVQGRAAVDSDVFRIDGETVFAAVRPSKCECIDVLSAVNGERADRGDVLDALCDGAYLEQIGADDQAAVEQAYTFALSL